MVRFSSGTRLHKLNKQVRIKKAQIEDGANCLDHLKLFCEILLKDVAAVVILGDLPKNGNFLDFLLNKISKKFQMVETYGAVFDLCLFNSYLFVMFI